jgi:RNA polymerase sigma factor (sigma-70 family)
MPADSNSGAQPSHPYRARLVSPEILDQLDRIANSQINRSDQVDLEDARQSVLAKLCTKLDAGKFHGDESDFIRWVSVVAKNHIRDLVRASQRHAHIDSLDEELGESGQTLLDRTITANPLDEADQSLLDILEMVDQHIRLRAAIHDVDQRDPQRQYLKLWQGMVAEKTQGQIASELGLKRQSDVSRRRKELIARLAIELGESPPNSGKSRKQLLEDRQSTDEEW